MQTTDVVPTRTNCFFGVGKPEQSPTVTSRSGRVSSREKQRNRRSNTGIPRLRGGAGVRHVRRFEPEREARPEEQVSTSVRSALMPWAAAMTMQPIDALKQALTVGPCEHTCLEDEVGSFLLLLWSHPKKNRLNLLYGAYDSPAPFLALPACTKTRSVRLPSPSLAAKRPNMTACRSDKSAFPRHGPQGSAEGALRLQ